MSATPPSLCKSHVYHKSPPPSLLLQLGVLPVSRLPWLPVHHGVRSSWWRVQTLQRVGLPCSVLPGAVGASNPAMRPAASSSPPTARSLPPPPPLPLSLPPFTQSFQHFLVLYHQDVNSTFVLFCCQMKMIRKELGKPPKRSSWVTALWGEKTWELKPSWRQQGGDVTQTTEMSNHGATSGQ